MSKKTRTETWKREFRALWKIGGPLVVNFIAIAGINFADAVMAGHIGPRHLAAVAVGGSVWFIGFIFCLGILMALSPIIAGHYGAGRFGVIGRYTRQGFWLSQALALSVLILALSSIHGVYEWFGIDADFLDLSVGYVRAIYLGLPAMTVFLVLRFTCEGIGITRPVMYTSLFSLVCNVFLNYVLMFGHFGFPALGAVGCGLASAITMWLMAAALALHVFTHHRYKKFEILSKVAPVRWAILKEVLTLGWPITISVSAEAGLFSAVSILIGTLGTNVAAAHQIAINFASTVFMIPLALSSAITVRVGHEMGAGDPQAARFAGQVGIVFCGCFMACSAVLMLLFRHSIVQLYTSDNDVQAIAISLLFMAALFQIADGIQIGAAGVLRGYRDTRVPMVINTFAYWGLGFPCAYMAAKVLVLEPKYIWAGLVLGLTVSAVLLTARYRLISLRAIQQELR